MARSGSKMLLLVAALTLAPDMSAVAHHSYAMFDTTNVVAIEGTVKAMEFTNPHAFLFVYVTGKDAKRVVWGMEAPAPGTLIRAGWSRTTVKFGDKVKVELNPLRDGRTGGFLRKVTLADGKVLCLPVAGPPRFQGSQQNACAGTTGGPPVVAGVGDPRTLGTKVKPAAPGSKPITEN